MSDHALAVTLIALPVEIIIKILSLLPKSALICLRSVNRDLALIVTPLAFRSLRLQGYGDDPQRFMKIAESNTLREFVREVTCDTWAGPDVDHRNGPDINIPHDPAYNFPSDFFDSLSFLLCFRNLDTLNLRFSYDCGEKDYTSVRENYTFRRHILDTIFHCLAGTWSKEKQREICVEESDYEIKKFPPNIPISPISLTTLTISNLADYNDPLFTESGVFRAVLNLRSLVDVRLYIATTTESPLRVETTRFPEKYDMFESLPSTWLSSPVAANLQVLSIYCHEWWGWLPKMDFRLVDELQNLKVLALGRFVFSHEWQIDWFGSLGLQEFYLDDCAVLHQAVQVVVDQSRSIVGQDAHGKKIIVSNAGYYDAELDINVISPGRIRWHNLLCHWRDSMSKLRVFKMGHGERARPRPTRYDEFFPDLFLSDNAFRNFDCPPPNATGYDMFRKGTGMSQSREKQLAYVFYSGNEWEGNFDTYMETRNYFLETEGEDTVRSMYEGRRDWSLEDGLIAKDGMALNLFISTLEARQISMASQSPH
ncbi:hypothetical protein G7Z17_g6783 [Cylindrodendrum hubeiense]|uniref:F-box domain-containing protein n=1 Tax=Cylindrodendrum hubeiense TaxID=595255 RepID=A0A9P5HBN9_9HYPO|nr:hypothetical protein G7Z17_g6783 [Cylindrodendrum hubeiense]